MAETRLSGRSRVSDARFNGSRRGHRLDPHHATSTQLNLVGGGACFHPVPAALRCRLHQCLRRIRGEARCVITFSLALLFGCCSRAAQESAVCLYIRVQAGPHDVACIRGPGSCAVGSICDQPDSAAAPAFTSDQQPILIEPTCPQVLRMQNGYLGIPRNGNCLAQLHWCF